MQDLNDMNLVSLVNVVNCFCNLLIRLFSLLRTALRTDVQVTVRFQLVSIFSVIICLIKDLISFWCSHTWEAEERIVFYVGYRRTMYEIYNEGKGNISKRLALRYNAKTHASQGILEGLGAECSKSGRICLFFKLTFLSWIRRHTHGWWGVIRWYIYLKNC